MTAFTIQIQELESSSDLQTVSDEELDRLHGGLGWDNVAGAAVGAGAYTLSNAIKNANNGKAWNDGLSAQGYATSMVAGALSPVNSVKSFAMAAGGGIIGGSGIDNLTKAIGTATVPIGIDTLMKAGSGEAMSSPSYHR